MHEGIATLPRGYVFAELAFISSCVAMLSQLGSGVYPAGPSILFFVAAMSKRCSEVPLQPIPKRRRLSQKVASSKAPALEKANEAPYDFLVECGDAYCRTCEQMARDNGKGLLSEVEQPVLWLKLFFSRSALLATSFQALSAPHAFVCDEGIIYIWPQEESYGDFDSG